MENHAVVGIKNKYFPPQAKSKAYVWLSDDACSFLSYREILHYNKSLHHVSKSGCTLTADCAC